jgi:hypothetical protein
MDHLIAWQLASTGHWDIPGVGTFRLERTPAVMEPGGLFLSAPHDVIRFDMRPVPLNSSAQPLSNKNPNAVEWDAINQTWQERIMQLSEGDSITIDLIGILQKKAGGLWHFVPDPTWILREGLAVQRVIRQNRDHVVLVGDAEMNRSQIVEQAAESSPATTKEHWLAIAATLLIAGLIWLGLEGFRSSGSFSDRYQHQSYFPIAVPETLYQLNP